MSKYLAIVPAYNEAASVSKVVSSIREHAPHFDVVVVDDGSTDKTADSARSAGATVLKLPFNLGIGGAVQNGLIYANENNYDFAIQVDGDGQHDAAEIGTLQRALDENPDIDVICGSRFLSQDYRYPAPVSRRTGIHIFSFLLSRIVRQRVSDPTSGFRLYRKRAIELFARDYPHDYPEVEAVLMLHHHRLKMKEVPVRMFARDSGVSSINTGKSAYYMIKVLLAIFIGLLRARPVPEPGGAAPVSAGQGI